MSTAWRIAAASMSLLAFGDAQASDVGALVALKGECVKLAAGGKDLTRSCGAAIARNITADGRTMFIFSTGEGNLLSIVGTGGVKQGAMRIVNLVTKAAGDGNAPVVKPASGTCTFGDPAKGPTAIECHGASDGKPLEAVFRTIGTQPN